MAFSSISKMTVPGSDAGAPEGLLMPKLQYRFRVLFENFGSSQPTTELTKQVMDVTRPNVSFPEIPIEVYNSRVYLAGKPTWEPVTVNVRDDASNNVTKLVGEQLQKQFDFGEQASAAAGDNYKFKLRIQILDGGNTSGDVRVLEEWECYGCYVSAANYNTLNYATNEAVTIALTIRFDNAVQARTDSSESVNPAYGVGSVLGRAIGDNVSGIGRG